MEAKDTHTLVTRFPTVERMGRRRRRRIGEFFPFLWLASAGERAISREASNIGGSELAWWLARAIARLTWQPGALGLLGQGLRGAVGIIVRERL